MCTGASHCTTHDDGDSAMCTYVRRLSAGCRAVAKRLARDRDLARDLHEASWSAATLGASCVKGWHAQPSESV
jgi:hypothetical protein